ncbi:NAD-dependent epimerase/dehydratase family protein [Candidatus Pelagibacter ubique]|nr:NAD-dependent epimerase/dehydratase family protein [Candidatus Pelagibacter ubique]
MVITITGALGLVGTNLINQFNQNAKVKKIYAIDLKKNNPEIKSKKIRYIYKSYTSERCLAVIKKSQIIVHLATKTNVLNSVENLKSEFKDYFEKTLKIYEIVPKNSIFIFSSTAGAIYGNTNKRSKESANPKPISPYGVIKLCLEHLLIYYSKKNKFNYIILRFSNVYGENSYHKNNLIPNLFKSFMENKKMSFKKNRFIFRDYIYVGDLVKIINQLMIKKITNQIFNLCSGKMYNNNEIFKKIYKQFKSKPNIKIKKSNVFYEIQKSPLSNELIKKKLNIKKFTSLEKGILKTKNWFEKI